MKTYSVSEVAKMLGTNEETVRRWIKDKKLESVITSKKTGHVITQTMLDAFLKCSPKYAASLLASGVVGTAIGAGAILTTAVVNSIFENQELKDAQIKAETIIRLLKNKIRCCQKTIEQKEDSIMQLQTEIKEEEEQICQMQEMINSLVEKTTDLKGAPSNE